MPNELKKISCQRCRFRKLKCSRTDPCSSCTTAKQSCEYRDRDEKRRPVSREYVTKLEDRVAWLESFISRIKAAAPQERASLLETVDLNDHLPDRGLIPMQEPSIVAETAQAHQPRLQLGQEGSLIYHGPTSIYRVQTDARSRRRIGNPMPLSPLYAGSDTNFEHVAQHFGIDLQGELITNVLMHFFRWQYPHFMFIYREAFLRDHFGDRLKSKYWSSVLLLAICALGALMMDNIDSRNISESFFAAAESIIIVSGFTQPCITTVQAFLCLAFYEIGRGNLSKGWGFSGIAFRMAQDLGFQRDPNHWISHDSSLGTPEDVEIRRRIYWGCYVSDKLICLILGRPVHLYYDDAEVEILKRLPDFPQMEPWLPVGFSANEGALGGVNLLVPCFMEQISLSKIIERMLAQLFSTKARLDSRGREAHFDTLNLELCRWQASLPECAQWNRWESPSHPLIPSVASLHALFHSVRIALHFDKATSPGSKSVVESSRSLCISSAQCIISIVRKYRSQYGLRHAPQIFIYGIVQAERATESLGITQESEYLSQTLEECSFSWGLAEQARQNMDTGNNQPSSR